MTERMTPSEAADDMFFAAKCCEDSGSIEAAERYERAAATILELEAREATFRTALEKIDAIRNSIIGYQRMGFSEHVYPLVAALDEAGFEGGEYEKCRDDVGTALQQRDSSETKLKIATEALPDLSHVINWFDKGCDVKRGIEELRIHEARITQALARIKEVG